MPSLTWSTSRAALLSVAFGLALTQGVARADVPSSEPETCTVDQMVARGGGECVECTGAYHGDRDACTRKMADTKLVHACNTQGASVWTEVWCEQKPGDAPVPETNARVGCSVTSASPAPGGSAPDSSGLAWSGLALAGLLGLRRRRVSPRA